MEHFSECPTVAANCNTETQIEIRDRTDEHFPARPDDVVRDGDGGHERAESEAAEPEVFLLLHETLRDELVGDGLFGAVEGHHRLEVSVVGLKETENELREVLLSSAFISFKCCSISIMRQSNYDTHRGIVNFRTSP